MRFSIVLAAMAALATTTPGFADGLKRVTQEAEFKSQFVGRTMTWDGGSQVIHADGRVTGSIPAMGGAYSGSWAWQAGFYCRNLVIQGKETGTDCLKIEVDGNTARLTRDQGRGRVYDVTLD